MRIAYASSYATSSPIFSSSTPFSSVVALPFALPFASFLYLFLALSLSLSYSPSSFTFLSVSRHLSPSLPFAPISHPPRRRVHDVPLFSPSLRAYKRSSFFSHIHPRPNDPSRLVPFRTFTFAAAKPYPTLRIIPSTRYIVRSIYVYK